MSLIETNQHMNMTFFYMNIYLQMKIKKKKTFTRHLNI